jgi:hypothetical protein
MNENKNGLDYKRIFLEAHEDVENLIAEFLNEKQINKVLNENISFDDIFSVNKDLTEQEKMSRMRDIKEKIQRTIKKINKNNENSNNHLTTNEIKDISSLLSSKMFHESRDKTINLSDYLNKISDENDIKPIIKQLKTEDMINKIGSHKFIVNNTSKPEYYISPESFEEFLELTDLDPTNKVKINNNIEKEELARLIFFLIIMNKKLSGKIGKFNFRKNGLKSIALLSLNQFKYSQYMTNENLYYLEKYFTSKKLVFKSSNPLVLLAKAFGGK